MSIKNSLLEGLTEEKLFHFFKTASVPQLQNATLQLKKHIMKKTLLALPTSTARRKYLKQLGIRFHNKSKLFSGGATVDIDLKDLLCPLTYMIFIQPVIAEDGLTYERSALVSVPRTDNIPHDDMIYSDDELDYRPRGSRNFIPNHIMRNTIHRLISQMPSNPEVRSFFERNWNKDLAAQLGIPNPETGGMRRANWRRSSSSGSSSSSSSDSDYDAPGVPPPICTARPGPPARPAPAGRRAPAPAAATAINSIASTEIVGKNRADLRRANRAKLLDVGKIKKSLIIGFMLLYLSVIQVQDSPRASKVITAMDGMMLGSFTILEKMNKLN